MSSPVACVADAILAAMHLPSSSEHLDANYIISHVLANPPLPDADLATSTFHSLPVHSIVSFSCMVTDASLPAETYIPISRGLPFNVNPNAPFPDSAIIPVSSLFRESLDPSEAALTFPVSLNSDGPFLEKQLYYCVSIPHESPWVSTQTSDLVASLDSLSIVDPSTSREETTQARSSQRDAKLMRLKAPHGLDLRAAVIKIYSDEQLAMNECIRVVGVLEYDTADPALAPEITSSAPHVDDALHDLLEEQTLPSPFSVPRIHVLKLTRMPKYSHPLAINPSPDVDVLTASEVAIARDILFNSLKIVLGGDALAAEFILLALMARIHATLAESIPVGPLPLNITNVKSPNMISNLQSLLKDIHHKVFYLPLDLETLKNSRFNAQIDTSSGSDGVLGVMAGSLQASDGTLLLIDETRLAPGQLDERGIRNLQTLKNYILWNRLPYVFEYQQIELVHDVGSIVLSEGKSMLQMDTHIPLTPITIDSPSVKLTQPEMILLRRYLCQTHSTPFTITDQTGLEIQNAFVAIRQDQKTRGAALMSQGELFEMINLARCFAIVRGDHSLTMSDWNDAVGIDFLRRDRISRISKTSCSDANKEQGGICTPTGMSIGDQIVGR